MRMVDVRMDEDFLEIVACERGQADDGAIPLVVGSELHRQDRQRFRGEPDAPDMIDRQQLDAEAPDMIGGQSGDISSRHHDVLDLGMSSQV